MVRAIDVANFFIDRMKDTDDPMTNARLNKFLYFAQGHSLARLGTPLFDDDIEAWRYGPVIKEIYNTFRTYGKNPIQTTSGSYSIELFTSEQLTLLNDVIAKYNHSSTGRLMDLGHEKDGPWDKTYSECAPDCIIQTDCMRLWFEDMHLPNSVLDTIMNRGTAGYRDSDGYLVLPKDYE